MLLLFGDAKVVLKVLLRLANEISTATMKLHTALNTENRVAIGAATPQSSLQDPETWYSYLCASWLSLKGTPTAHYHLPKAENLSGRDIGPAPRLRATGDA